MNIVCNNELLYVVDYPAYGAVEVIDKRRGRGALMRDATARQFRAELDSLAASSDPDEFERMMGHYAGLMTQPAIYQ